MGKGISLRRVQVLLGHNSLKTTEICTHVARIDHLESPLLDWMDIGEIHATGVMCVQLLVTIKNKKHEGKCLRGLSAKWRIRILLL